MTADDTFRVLKRLEFDQVVNQVANRSSLLDYETVVRIWAVRQFQRADIQPWFRELLDNSGWTLFEFTEECIKRYDRE